MDEFIKAFIDIDNTIIEQIIEKLKNNKKLEDFEKDYIITWYKIIERYKK